MWTEEEDITLIIKEEWQDQHQQLHQKLESTLARLHQWGRKKFGVLPIRIKEAQNELQHIIENNANGDLMDNVRKK
jgi:hypothetical protein